MIKRERDSESPTFWRQEPRLGQSGFKFSFTAPIKNAEEFPPAYNMHCIVSLRFCLLQEACILLAFCYRRLIEEALDEAVDALMRVSYVRVVPLTALLHRKYYRLIRLDVSGFLRAALREAGVVDEDHLHCPARVCMYLESGCSALTLSIITNR